MSSFAYYNGLFKKKEEIKIPLSDRSIFFGDAIYDVAIGSYDRILWEDEHIDRFLNNAKRLGIKHKYSKRYLSDLIREISVRSMLDSYMIYFQLSRDNNIRTHSSVDAGSNLLITVDPIDIEPYPKPIKLITLPDLRHGYCDIKTVNLLPAVISANKAEEAGCDEAIFIKNGYVTECTKSNILIIKQGRVITPPLSPNILPGIVRANLLKICHNKAIPFDEKPITRADLFSADEVLITSTTKMCKAVDEINSTKVGGRHQELVKILQQALFSEFQKCHIF